MNLHVTGAYASPATGIAAVKAIIESGELLAADKLSATLRKQFPRSPVVAVQFARCAVRRKDWPEAVTRWSDCRSSFPDNPGLWRSGLANALLECKKFNSALAEFKTLIVEEPQSVPARVGLARSLGGISPAEGENAWIRLFEETPGPHPVAWLGYRSAALESCGRFDDAVAHYENAIASDGANQAPLLKQYTWLLRRGNLRDKARKEVTTGRLREGGGAQPLDRLHLCLWLGELQAARNSFDLVLKDVATVAGCVLLLEILPQAYEHYGREQKLRELQNRVAALEVKELDRPEWLCLMLRIDIALRDYAGFRKRYGNAEALPEPWSARFHRLAEILDAGTVSDFEAPRIFGIGLSKTGTSSLGAALDRLGYLHAHFNNPFSMTMIDEKDLPLFDAITDTPASNRFELLYHMFPNARFVLTERPFDSWERSLVSHFQRHFGTADFAQLARRASDPKDAHGIGGFAALHSSLYYQHGSPRSAFERYMRRVEHFFADKPAGKLLRFNIFNGDGWQELCSFLGRETPDEPFPWANKTPSQVRVPTQPTAVAAE